MKFSIRVKLIAFTFCVVLLVGGSISFYSTYIGRQRIFTTFDNEARETTTLISRTILSDLYFLDVQALRYRLESARANPDIDYTYVTDLKGVVLADGIKKNSLRGRKLTDAFSQEMLRSDGWLSRIEGEALKVGGPIFMPDGARIGHLYVGFSLGRAHETARKATIANLYITLICLGIGIVLAFVVATSFSRPILSMVQASREIGEGKLDTRLLINRDDELGVLAGSFDQMAATLERHEAETKRAEDEIQRNLGRIQALREIDLAITSTLELDDVLHLLLEKIDLLLPYSTATIRLFNKESELLEPAACHNLDQKEWKEERWKAGRGPANAVFEAKAPRMIRDCYNDPRVRDPGFFRKHELISYLGVPLIVKNELIGVISFYTKEEHEYTKEEIVFLTTLASQAAVAIHNSQLYKEIAELAGDLAKSNRIKDEFLSVMSHELRTPLNVVMGYTGMVKDGMLGEMNQQQGEALGKVLTRSRDLLSMITSILQVTSIEGDEVKVERNVVNLGDFLSELRSSYAAPLDKEVVLVWDYSSELPVLSTDSAKLKQIFQNLINNGIKFTEKGHVIISVRYFPEEKILEIKVADTGIGISKEMLPAIFDKFYQVDSSETRRYGGVGLGLYIVKKFTELLGGKVGVESELNKGSIFTVTIPQNE